MGSQDQGADATQGRWLTIPRALCFVRHGDAVLLMKRALHKRVFPGCYNGVGGHIERDEDPAASIRREILEETGLHVRELRLRGVHNIDAGGATGILMFVFTALSDTRATQSDEREGTLHWVPLDKVASLDLVEDLPLILPKVLSMADDAPPYFAHVSYDENDSIQLRLS